jgi:ATP-dependent protease ClpP protease subunit
MTEFNKEKQLLITATENASTHYKVFLTDEIKEPSYYDELIELLDSTSDNDIVHYRINSGGGDLYSAVSILNGNTSSSAFISCDCDGMIASGATMVMMSCSQITLKPFSMYMFHSARGTLGFQADSVQNSYYSVNRHNMGNLYWTVYKDILTQDELKSMIDADLHIWLDWLDLAERFRQSVNWSEVEPYTFLRTGYVDAIEQQAEDEIKAEAKAKLN